VTGILIMSANHQGAFFQIVSGIDILFTGSE